MPQPVKTAVQRKLDGEQRILGKAHEDSGPNKNQMQKITRLLLGAQPKRKSCLVITNNFDKGLRQMQKRVGIDHRETWLNNRTLLWPGVRLSNLQEALSGNVEVPPQIMPNILGRSNEIVFSLHSRCSRHQIGTQEWREVLNDILPKLSHFEAKMNTKLVALVQ